MSDLVDYVVEDLVASNGGYPVASRMKGSKQFKRNFVEFWEAFVTECYESELLFTSTIVHQFVDWLTTLTRYDNLVVDGTNRMRNAHRIDAVSQR